jgi:hypothetical protein
MKVRVTYATELSGLSQKMSELLHENVIATQEIVSLIDSIASILKIDREESIIYSHQALDRVRKRLAQIDESLADIGGLMGGYINNVLDPQPRNIQPPAPPPVPSEIQEESKKYWDNTTRSLKSKSVANQEQE